MTKTQRQTIIKIRKSYVKDFRATTYGTPEHATAEAALLAYDKASGVVGSSPKDFDAIMAGTRAA